MPTQLPLTFQQQWLWSLLYKQPNWKCMLTYGFRLRGALRLDHLQRSLEGLIARHSSLRARVVVVDGSVMQEVTEPIAVDLQCISVDGAGSAEIEANARRLFADFSNQGVNLAVDALLRITLLKLSDEEHWLLVSTHRLIADCFSVDQMMPELWSLYEETIGDRPISLSPDPPQYHAYAIRQQQNYPEWLKKHGGYWKQRLDVAQNLRWPSDGSVAQLPRGTLGRMRRLLDEKLSAGLREVARSERALLATVMLAVYVTALYRFCQQRDFVVPFFVAGRQSQQRSIVGYFSHILYLRMELTGAETFKDVLSNVANELFRAFTHQDFGAIALQEPRLLQGTFFQWLTWDPEAASGLARVAATGSASLAVERVTMTDFAEDVTAIPPGMVDVETSFFDTEKGIYASGVYRADLFTPQTIERFMDELSLVARQFVQNPHAIAAPSSDRINVPWQTRECASGL